MVLFMLHLLVSHLDKVELSIRFINSSQTQKLQYLILVKRVTIGLVCNDFLLSQNPQLASENGY